MRTKRYRLDRFISSELQISRKAVKPLLAQGRIQIDGEIAKDAQQFVEEFSLVTYAGKILQNKTPHYLMLYKPKGVVSATKDKQHKTVIDLLNVDYRNDLHIVGRLDFNSTGLLLLTNNGRWSRALMSPESKLPKRYLVKLEKPVTQAMVQAFAQGMYFQYENLTTKAAELKIVSEYIAEVSLSEGRYHQIKRMFGRFQNKVLEIHRIAIGKILLDEALRPGQARRLKAMEISL